MKKLMRMMRIRRIVKLAYLGHNSKIVFCKFTSGEFVKVITINKRGYVREMLFRYGADEMLSIYEDSSLSR